ncbi:MAG TPA: ABC transporter permease [Candidatus Fimimorpha excrementavium]|nr:ABC transporter permease [Candidatus Fimimorpha excrementavium]
MNGIKIIFNKEMHRVWKDPKMILSLFVLPVVMMIFIYGLIGMLGSRSQEEAEMHRSIVSIQNAPDGLAENMQEFEAGAEITYLSSEDSVEEVKQGIYDGDVDLLVVFPEDFIQNIRDYQEGQQHPDVQTFYNPSETYSELARERFVGSMQEYEKRLLAERFGSEEVLTAFTIDATNTESQIMDTKKAGAAYLSMMLPYLITLLLFAGTMSLGTDTISGEKERGTMASMLVTPVKRSSIVLGKLLALTVLSLISALVYIVSMVVAMPKAMAGMGEMSLTLDAGQIVMIAFIMLTLAFLYVALVGIVAVYARTVKEAGSYVTPIYLIVIVAGIITMFSGNDGHSVVEYLIPIYNSSVALGDILSGELEVTSFFMTIASSLAAGGILTFGITKAFDNEHVMFHA